MIQRKFRSGLVRHIRAESEPGTLYDSACMQVRHAPTKRVSSHPKSLLCACTDTYSLKGSIPQHNGGAEDNSQNGDLNQLHPALQGLDWNPARGGDDNAQEHASCHVA